MNCKTYGLVGLGLIGGSLAKALKRSQPDCRILAYTRSSETLRAAASQGIINEVCHSPGDPKFKECEYVFLCAPVGANIHALEQLKDSVSPSCILTDVGSVKTEIHEAAARMGLEGSFIGGHPMTGSEKSGILNSQAHLFENSYYVITPTSKTDESRIQKYKELVSALGALPIVMDYRQHDFITAAVSHLPHVIAAALVNTVHDLDSKEEYMKLIAAGGFKDITRIASSSPEMWEQICIENAENISQVMDTFIQLMEQSRTAMIQGTGSEIYRAFERSRDYRDSFSSSPLGSIKKTYRIYCDIVDESGAIATIATILAVNNISIKNIGIVHNREFEEGVLRIEFYEEDPSLKAAEVLKQHRYKVWIR